MTVQASPHEPPFPPGYHNFFQGEPVVQFQPCQIDAGGLNHEHPCHNFLLPVESRVYKRNNKSAVVSPAEFPRDECWPPEFPRLE